MATNEPSQKRLEQIADSIRGSTRGQRPSNMDGRDLSGIDLAGRTIRAGWFRKAKLRGANLTGTDFTSTDFGEADLTGANLSGANLESANLEKAKLDNANLTGANLRDAVLSDASLRNANASGASFRGAFLYNADLTGAEIGGAIFKSAILRGVTAPDGVTSNYSNKTFGTEEALRPRKDRKKRTLGRAIKAGHQISSHEVAVADVKDFQNRVDRQRRDIEQAEKRKAAAITPKDNQQADKKLEDLRRFEKVLTKELSKYQAELRRAENTPGGRVSRRRKHVSNPKVVFPRVGKERGRAKTTPPWFNPPRLPGKRKK